MHFFDVVLCAHAAKVRPNCASSTLDAVKYATTHTHSDAPTDLNEPSARSKWRSQKSGSTGTPPTTRHRLSPCDMVPPGRRPCVGLPSICTRCENADPVPPGVVACSVTGPGKTQNQAKNPVFSMFRGPGARNRPPTERRPGVTYLGTWGTICTRDPREPPNPTDLQDRAPSDF